MDIMAKQIGTKVITGMVRFSYANLFEAKAAKEGQEAKFSVSLIIPKSDIASLKIIKAAIDEAKKEGASKWGGKIPAGLKMPLRDGDTDRPDDGNYENCYFVNANSKQKPQIVDKNRNPVTEESLVYSGCYGRASLTFYGYNSNGSKGIACGLQNIQKLEEGEPLSGRSRAEDDFEALEDEENDFLS